MASPQLTIGELFSSTATVFSRRTLLLFVIAIVPYLLMFAVIAVVGLSIRLSLSPGSLPIDPVATYKSFSIAQRLGVIVAFLICSWWPLALGQAGIIFATSDSRLGRHSTLQNVAVRVARHLFRTVAIFSIIALASAIGAVLFIVPGILIQSVTAFALPAAVIENLSIAAGMRRSMKLTRGSFGKILVVYLIAVLVLFALGLGALTVLAEGNSLLWLPIIFSSLWAIEILLTITLTLLYFHASQNGLAAKTVL